MSAAWLLTLALANDFWRVAAGSAYDAAIEQGTRLLRQAEETCSGCREGAPRFGEMQAYCRQAADLFERAARLRPRDVDPSYFAGHARYEAREFEAALRDFEEARRRQPDGPRAGDVAFDLGTTLSRLERFDRAIEEYGRALHYSQDPYERAILFVNTAESQMALGRLEQAIGLYRRGVDAGAQALRAGGMQASSQALHLMGLAVALDRDEQEAKGLAQARRALELDSALGQLHDPHVFFVPEGDIAYYEGLTELARGRRSEAAQAFAAFLRLVPQSPFAARARAHLAALGAPVPAPTAAGRRAGSPPEAGIARAHPRTQRGGVVATRGPLPSPELDAAMHLHEAEIAACLGDREGSFSLHLALAPSGQVSRLDLEGRFPEAERCLRQAARAWSFRAADHARATRFVYRMVLSP